MLRSICSNNDVLPEQMPVQKMFKTIVITKPSFFVDEAKAIVGLLDRVDIDMLHLRKPGAAKDDVERLIREIPREWHNRLVVHEHFSLAERYGLYGIHLNSRFPTPPYNWRGSVSRSCHSFEEVAEWKSRCDYVSLSPVFDSISKRGYVSAFTAGEIAQAVDDGMIDDKVYALGGMTFSRLAEVKDMGFGGAMILGDAWKG